MKRLVVGGVLAVMVAVSPVASAFLGLAPCVDGTEVAPGVTQVSDGPVNSFIVQLGEGRVALVDCGADRQAERIIRRLHAQGFSADQVTAIFLTHGHRDHLGGCHQFPRAVVYALEAEQPLIEGRVVARGPLPRFRSAASDLEVHVDRAMQSGDSVQVGVLAQVFGVPGHTAGSAAWLLRGVLFMGDSATLERSGSLRPAAWVFSDDQRENRTSLEALPAKLPARVEALAFGHSGPTRQVDWPVRPLLAE